VGEGDFAPKLYRLRSLDYFGCGVEFSLNEAHFKRTAALWGKIKEVVGSLDKDTVARACRSFRSRIEAFVAADGDFIE